MHSRLAPTPRLTSLIVSTVVFAVLFPIGITGAQIMRSPGSQQVETNRQQDIRWPKPGQLLKEIERFEELEVTSQWAARTKQLVVYLCTETAVTNQDAADTLMAVHQQSQAINTLMNQITSSNTGGQASSVEATELISDLQRFQYRLNRRLEVWATVLDYSEARDRGNVTPIKTVSLSRLPRELDRLLAAQDPRNTDGWQDYLAWDALVKAGRVTNMDKKARIELRKAAQKFLARYHSPALTEEQRQLFQPHFSPEMLHSIRSVASGEVEFNKLMTAIEILEKGDTGKYPYQPGKYALFLNRQYQNLLWSDDPIAQKLAATIDTHWRNANVRIAINERLLNLMLPQVPAMTEPVSERVQGAKVSGQSLIENQLQIALIPNPNEISLGIETVGQVTSETVSEKSGFIFQNRGMADFKVFQKLAFSRTGVTSEAPFATSSAKQRLIAMRGSFDRVPLIGRLTRMIAKQKVEESTPAANQLTRERVESGAKTRVEQEVNQLVGQLRRGMHKHVLSRLISMDLEPETVQLSTSQQRIVGRYRVAGRDQMAAFQPRPTDFESDLLTVQFHQSAINNLIDRFELNGKEFNAVTLGKHVAAITGIPYQSPSANADARFKFAKYDAVRLEFEEGVASLTFNFRSFQIGKGRPWKNFAIKANFKPRYVGTQVVLELDNFFPIKSKSKLGFGDHVAIRGAFKVILEEQYAFDLMPQTVQAKVPNLVFAIDRLSLADGWCGVAIENVANVVLQQPPVETLRTARQLQSR